MFCGFNHPLRDRIWFVIVHSVALGAAFAFVFRYVMFSLETDDFSFKIFAVYGIENCSG